MINLRILLMLWCMAYLGLYGCGQKESLPVVSIQKTSPSGNVALVAGETVIFEIDARVQGIKTTGTVSLIVQASNGTVLGECAPIQVINGATVKLTAVVVIPEDSSVQIFVPLYLADDQKTSVLDTRTFKVFGKLAK